MAPPNFFFGKIKWTGCLFSGTMLLEKFAYGLKGEGAGD